jgi:hypothetical protein
MKDIPTSKLKDQVKLSLIFNFLTNKLGVKWSDEIALKFDALYLSLCSVSLFCRYSFESIGIAAQSVESGGFTFKDTDVLSITPTYKTLGINLYMKIHNAMGFSTLEQVSQELDKKVAQWGPNHLEVAGVLSRLAEMCKNQGKFTY